MYIHCLHSRHSLTKQKSRFEDRSSAAYVEYQISYLYDDYFSLRSQREQKKWKSARYPTNAGDVRASKQDPPLVYVCVCIIILCIV